MMRLRRNLSRPRVLGPPPAMGASQADRRARAREVFDRLERAMPEAKIELHYRSDLELLVSVILSAQCTDKRVNMVTPALFARFKSAADYAAVRPRALHPFVQSCGLYRAKAKAIVAAMRAI